MQVEALHKHGRREDPDDYALDSAASPDRAGTAVTPAEEALVAIWSLGCPVAVHLEGRPPTYTPQAARTEIGLECSPGNIRRDEAALESRSDSAPDDPTAPPAQRESCGLRAVTKIARSIDPGGTFARMKEGQQAATAVAASNPHSKRVLRELAAVAVHPEVDPRPALALSIEAFSLWRSCGTSGGRAGDGGQAGHEDK
jgi:hypothetical protein